MSRSDEKRLTDIRRMCATAADLVGRGRAAIDSDPALWLALERVIEIAGEAATSIGDDTRSPFPRSRGVSSANRTEAVRAAVEAHVRQKRREHIDAALVQGHTEAPTHQSDEWGDLAAQSDAAARAAMAALDAEDGGW